MMNSSAPDPHNGIARWVLAATPSEGRLALAYRCNDNGMMKFEGGGAVEAAEAFGRLRSENEADDVTLVGRTCLDTCVDILFCCGWLMMPI